MKTEIKTLKKHLGLVALFTLYSIFSFAQNSAEQTKVNEYLNSTVKYSNQLLVNSSVQTVIKDQILTAELSVNIGDKYNDAYIISSCFINNDGQMIPIKSIEDVICSPELIASFKRNKFKLKTEENGIALQSFFGLIDGNKPLGFFQVNETWYFIRDKFFDDVKGYEVTIDKKSNIVSIKYHYELKIEIPETILAENKTEKYDRIKNVVTKKDSIATHDYLLQNADFKFSPSDIELPAGIKKTALSLYDCKLECFETYSDGSEGSSVYSFNLASHKGKYEKFRNRGAIVESDIFVENVLKTIKINSVEDAKVFQDILDEINPVEKSFELLKKFYLEDGVWFFLRKTSFDDIYGYMVNTDEKGMIKYVAYDQISEENTLRFKMKDADFKVDYKFKLVSPSTSKVTVKRGEGLSVEISFDEKPVNAKGLWLYSRFDGNNYGMYASSSMESPYTTGITGMALENEYHTLEFFLLESGGTDIENALGTIKIEIKVED